MTAPADRRRPRPMPYWFANLTYRRVGKVRLQRDAAIPFNCDWDTVRMLAIRRRVSQSPANVRRYGQGHPYAKAVMSLQPRSYLIRRHTIGAWR